MDVLTKKTWLNPHKKKVCDIQLVCNCFFSWFVQVFGCYSHDNMLLHFFVKRPTFKHGIDLSCR